MIDTTQLNIEWITKVSKSNRNADRILVEKVIRSLLLLEGLVQVGLPFVFKGGTSLMLHFNSSKRLSIDIDILIAHRIKHLDETLRLVANMQGFSYVKPQQRTTESDIEKAHYLFFYLPIHKTAKEEEYVLLDILFEEIGYTKIEERSIVSQFVPLKGNLLSVRVPCLDDLLGDKLTAFAPNTTGIPYYKGEDSMSMEIIKQLYDIGSLFDRSTNLKIVKETFHRFARTELAYRKAIDKNETDVLADIFHTALCITSRGELGKGDFDELQSGIRRVAGFIFSENYHIEKAIISASKASYLSALISLDKTEIEKFDNPMQIKDWLISNPLYNKLNKLKKSNPEAFFYWHKTIEIITIENSI
ncbi:MAG: nucleotidyl transferase AbiEii/AbiGii toxin family protein [Candidatus Babeliales bacterium]|jgi:predicted nucleotidyltransferase component of viral defense system